jgi:isocitrate/isopropylmalate dehydrogenase
MTGKRSYYRVACLAGDGVGPEVMAEASRAIAAVSRHHGFTVEERHVPFGGEALSRSGHLLPAGTRAAYLTADAVLVADADEPALAGVVAELELQARVAEVRVNGKASVRIVAPVAEETSVWAVERAFATALARAAQLTVVSPGERFAQLVDEVGTSFDGVLVEHVEVAETVRRLVFEPEGFDVVLTGAGLGEALAGLVGSGTGDELLAATGLVGEGPGVFAPARRGAGAEEAGQGVANPCSMLLAAAVMLSEGLGERTAASTLAAALGGAVEAGRRTPDMVATGVGSTTREFMDVLLAELPRRVPTFEFSREAYAA